MSRSRRIAVFALVMIAAAVVSGMPRYLRAAALLIRFADPETRGGLARLGTLEVDVVPTTIERNGSPVPARLYVPRGIANAPAVVLLHGVHRLSIDEPRLVRFARAIAESGVVVLTPAIAEIAAYEVDPASIETIGAAALSLQRDRHRRVGLIGMSFAGGLALLAAADARYKDAICAVLSIGGHDDLKRVAQYFASDVAPEPDGGSHAPPAHPYGALVVAHANASGFFAPEEQATARAALSAWLGERWDEAKAEAARLSPESRSLVERLFAGKLREAPRAFLDGVARAEARMARVSPHGHLGNVTARVFLLHGQADSVIPASEARWLIHDLPAGSRPTLLVSSAIGHVELAGTPSVVEQAELVHFMAGLLDAI